MRSKPVHDPGLPAEFRDEPAGFHCDEGKEAGQHERAREPNPGERRPKRVAAAHQRATSKSAVPLPDHRIETEMHDLDRRFVRTRKRVEPAHFRLRIAEGQETQQVREFDSAAYPACRRVGDSADEERRPARGLKVRFGRSEFHGLVVRVEARRDVAGDDLQRYGERGDVHPDLERLGGARLARRP